MKQTILSELEASARLKQEMARSLFGEIEKAARAIIRAYRQDRKLVLFGNGGSAADAQHFASELVGRFARERRALNALALTTDTSVITSVGNDYGYEAVFSRQVEAVVRPGDVAIAISTSGASPNVVAGVKAARRCGAYTIGLLGNDGGTLGPIVDLAVVVPAKETSRIQEGHGVIIHILCKLVEEEIFGAGD